MNEQEVASAFALVEGFYAAFGRRDHGVMAHHRPPGT